MENSMNTTNRTILNKAYKELTGRDAAPKYAHVADVTVELDYAELEKGVLKVEVSGHVHNAGRTEFFSFAVIGADAVHFLNVGVKDAVAAYRF
jgi:hypothetical protein